MTAKVKIDGEWKDIGQMVARRAKSAASSTIGPEWTPVTMLDSMVNIGEALISGTWGKGFRAPQDGYYMVHINPLWAGTSAGAASGTRGAAVSVHPSATDVSARAMKGPTLQYLTNSSHGAAGTAATLVYAPSGFYITPLVWAQTSTTDNLLQIETFIVRMDLAAYTPPLL